MFDEAEHSGRSGWRDCNEFISCRPGSAEPPPSEMMMPVDDLVDATLIGFYQGELVTIPSLPNAAG